MNRTFKMIASRGSEVIFDDRIEAATPREARKLLKDRLGLTSLSGIVCSITELPVDLIREIRKGADAIAEMLTCRGKEARDAA